MRVRKYRYMVCDFETTVYKGQVHTEVWASAVVEMYTDEVKIFHSIGETLDYMTSLDCNLVCYYHNLKFDGAFWLAYFLAECGYEQAFDKQGSTLSDEEWLRKKTEEGASLSDIKWLPEKCMRNNTFKFSVSDMGQWYSIILKVKDHFIEFRDSLKLLPFSVKRIGESFKTKHKKLDMEYTGFRYAGCSITDEEKHYIANDVLVVKEALEIMFNEGHNKLTIGSCCLEEYKRIIGKEQYQSWFPNMYDIELDTSVHRYPNAGEWIRKSYKGGWCYLVKGKQNRRFYDGSTADVNSLYPSMMSSESGNLYPIGEPTFWQGDYIPYEALYYPKRYYFVRIKTRFYIKPGYLPFIQLKGNILYQGNECLESSDVYDPETQKYYAHYLDLNGNLVDTRVELTLTQTDFQLLKEHYNLVDFEILDGCWFRSECGIFDEYIEKYKKIKLEAKGALRELAKLFLNNLYGKMASSMDSSFKIAYVKEDKSIGFMAVSAKDKTPGYIPVGSAITSYARNFTIRAAQKNYHGVDKPGFVYADTDSIHCDLKPDQIKGITVHDKNFCCWKLESEWDVAWFTRQKTYIEHIVVEDGKPLETPYYNVKCAGMPEKCKQLFIKSLERYTPKETDKFTDDELAVINKHYNLEDFNVGLKVPGKLRPKRIRGGVLLVDCAYEMR